MAPNWHVTHVAVTKAAGNGSFKTTLALQAGSPRQDLLDAGQQLALQEVLDAARARVAKLPEARALASAQALADAAGEDVAAARQEIDAGEDGRPALARAAVPPSAAPPPPAAAALADQLATLSKVAAGREDLAEKLRAELVAAQQEAVKVQVERDTPALLRAKDAGQRLLELDARLAGLRRQAEGLQALHEKAKAEVAAARRQFQDAVRAAARPLVAEVAKAIHARKLDALRRLAAADLLDEVCRLEGADDVLRNAEWFAERAAETLAAGVAAK